MEEDFLEDAEATEDREEPGREVRLSRRVWNLRLDVVRAVGMAGRDDSCRIVVVYSTQLGLLGLFNSRPPAGGSLGAGDGVVVT